MSGKFKVYRGKVKLSYDGLTEIESRDIGPAIAHDLHRHFVFHLHTNVYTKIAEQLGTVKEFSSTEVYPEDMTVPTYTIKRVNRRNEND